MHNSNIQIQCMYVYSLVHSDTHLVTSMYFMYSYKQNTINSTSSKESVSKKYISTYLFHLQSEGNRRKISSSIQISYYHFFYLEKISRKMFIITMYFLFSYTGTLTLSQQDFFLALRGDLPVQNSNPSSLLVRKYIEISSRVDKIGSPPSWTRSYVRNSDPVKVTSGGSLPRK